MTRRVEFNFLAPDKLSEPCGLPLVDSLWNTQQRPLLLLPISMMRCLTMLNPVQQIRGSALHRCCWRMR